MKLKTYQRGFTLIELMIAVVVISILSSVAYPNYTQYVRKTHRANAKTALLRAAQWMERAATATGKYPETLVPALQDVEGKRYTLSLDTTSTTESYTLTATPNDTGGQDKDPCGTYTLSHNGQRGATGGEELCW